MFPIELVKFSEDIPTDVVKLWELVVSYCEKEQWEDALTLSQIALKELEKGLESDSRDVGLILSIAGFINKEIGKYDDAESLWKRAILILEKNDKELSFTCKIMRELVYLFLNDKRWEEADFFLRKFIGIYEKSNEIDAYQRAFLKWFHSTLCLELKNSDEAKQLLRAALPAFVEKFGFANVEVEKIFRWLEAAHFWKNNYAESKESFKNANEISDAIPLCSLGMLCEEENFPGKATDYYKRAINIYESKGSQDDSQLADINLKLGKCFLKIGNWLGSQIYLDKSRAILKKTLADDDAVMLDVNIHLALCYVRLEEFNEARKIHEEILGNVHTDESGVSIVKLAEDNEENEEAKLPTLKGKSNIIDCALTNLSALYILDGKYKAAKTLQDFRESKLNLIEDGRI